MGRFKWNKATLVMILALAWPTMLEQLMQTAVQYVDTAMVGSLGTQATAAVGSTTTVNWLVNSSVSALGVGFLAIIAQALGAGDKEKARRAVAQSVMITVFFGILLTALTTALSGWIPVWMQVDPQIQTLAGQYFLILYLPMLPRTATILFGTALRAAGDTKTPMKIGIWVNLTNVTLNFLMIYPTRYICLGGMNLWIPGLGWGVLGAAAASAVAFTLGGILITAKLLRHPVISPRGCSFRPDMEILRPGLRVALPNMLQRFGTCAGYVAFAGLVNGLGPASTAAHTIANTVESAFYIPGYGMQTAAATLAGNAWGARDRKGLSRTVSMFLPLEVVLMTLSGGLLFWLAPTLVGLFSKDAQVIGMGTTVLRMVALSEPFYGFSIIMEGVMQGVGKTRLPLVYNLAGMWLVRIVGTYLCTRLLGLGLIAAWACMIAHNMTIFICFLVTRRLGLWLPKESAAPEITSPEG